ncbi:hypothetical protein HZC34_02825 [Candidatus Saganbacteria bacterium]|nr:hypothetical protein [Candidatus Saganbacteria bacterium]
MIECRWLEEYSESFGSVYRPVAEVYMKDKSKVWRAINMYVDSGADISIMTKDHGELFGHDINKGKKIRLKGIGSGHINAYIHKMELLIGKHEIEVDVAIAENNEVPNVLGRKIIFDLFEIQFKNIKKHTCFIRKA